MAEGETPAKLEQEIASIERELAEKREVLRRESLHEVIRQKIADAPTPQPQVQPSPAPTPASDGTSVPPQLFHKVQALVNTAFLKSIDEAIKEAKATNNAALIDAFHDLLVDELYNHLIERGKLKQM
ncbi:MAG: hypothetical protein AAB420_00195 [Patescibacteria group bacterium]